MCQSDNVMKSIGHYGITLLILLICNPVVYCHWYQLDEIMREIKVTQKMIKKLDEQQSWMLQLPKSNDGLPQLGERLANVETSVNNIMSQMQSTSTQLTNTEETLSAIKKSIASQSSTDQISRRLDNIEHILNSTLGENKLNLNKDTIRTMCLGMVAEDSPLERQISETDKLLKKYDQKLNTYNDNVDGVTNNLVKLNRRLDSIEERCPINISDVMEHHGGEIKKMHQLLTDVDNTIKDLPRRSDSIYALNSTLDAVRRIEHNITEIKNSYFMKLTNDLLNMNNALVAMNQSIKCLSQNNTMGDQAYYDIMENFGSLFLQIQALSSKESMILQTVSKIDVVHGTNFLEIRNLIKNKTLHSNYDINNSITGAQPSPEQISKLLSIANKIESEMECLSYDIIDIYDVTVNRATLDNGPVRNEQFFNASVPIVDDPRHEVDGVIQDLP